MTDLEHNTDRFYCLINNYVVHEQAEGVAYFELLSHQDQTLDAPLAYLCQHMQRMYMDDYKRVVNMLSQSEVSFIKFADTLKMLTSRDPSGMTYNRIAAGIAICGAYVKRLWEIEESEDFPDYYENPARFRNQASQAITYMSKLLANATSSRSSSIFEEFTAYVVEACQRLQNMDPEGLPHSSVGLSVIIGVVVVGLGVSGAILYRLR